MEILRTTRDRASTFDFFGTHTRDRTNTGSFTDLSNGEPRDLQRQRVGSMDLYYSQRNTQQQQKQKHDKSQNKPKLKRKLSFATTPSSADMPQDDYFLKHQSLREPLGEGDDEEGYLFDEFGLVTLSYEVNYYGPAHTACCYDTCTPPTSWSEVSRRIIPQDIMLKLRRRLELDMNQGILTVKEPTSGGRWDFSMPAQDCSIHVEHPVEGAIVNLYVKGTPKDEWMEHTFDSAQMAAQFQLDLLAYQVLGRTLNNMFQVLSMIHRGSQAYSGHEYVLHFAPATDEVQDDPTTQSTTSTTTTTALITAVAWDDAMRALSSIPTIRIALERLWLQHRRPGDDALSNNRKMLSVQAPPPETSDSEFSLLTEEYSGKRLLLGPVDFFRLFIPALPDTAIPQNDSNRARMEQLLSWRKRAARAAVLIRTYALSRRVVNLGWNLIDPVDKQARDLKRRLAFDDNEENNRRDTVANDEIYEASVSRDVLCYVRPFDFFRSTNRRRKPGLVLSPYQAYTLVGVHIFRKPDDHDPIFSLSPSRDPVQAIPSLRKLISSNSNVDFFVATYHRNDTVSVMCYARSLAKGIDPQFDNVISRFTNGNETVRDKKVHMMVQIGQSQTLSFLGMLLVRFLAFLVRLTQKGRESPMSLQSRRDRIPLPAIRVASYGETFHFGGALQTDDTLPKNYVAMTTSFTPKRMPNLLSKIMFKNLNDRVSERVLDFTLVLEGEQEDELPERALCTTRMVRVDTDAVAVLPLGCVDKGSHLEHIGENQLQSESLQLWTHRMATEFVTAVRSNLTLPRWQKHSGEIMPDHPSTTSNETSLNNDQPSHSDVINTAIDEILALLEGINVPVKSDSIYAKFAPLEDTMESSTLPEGMVLVPVRNMTNRDDVKYFAISTYCNVKAAAARIVQTAAWLGRTFPVDIRSCRIELQSGQFFHQGNDSTGHPVFYFTTMCRGPWRRNAEATLSAGLHRFQTMISNVTSTTPDASCTIVIFLGRPKSSKTAKDTSNKVSEEESTATQEDAGETGTMEQSEEENGKNDDVDHNKKMTETCTILSNPRVSTEEPWQLHSTRELVEGFISSVLLHYPQRIHMVLLVKGQGPNIFYKTKGAAIRAMNRAVDLGEISAGLKFLASASKLKMYIDESQVPGVIGGPAPLVEDAFEYA